MIFLNCALNFMYWLLLVFPVIRSAYPSFEMEQVSKMFLFLSRDRIQKQFDITGFLPSFFHEDAP